MRCGVLCDKDGNIKRRWSLVNDSMQIALEADGDETIEWIIDHGQPEDTDSVRSEKIAAAVSAQRRISTLQNKQDTIALRNETEQKDRA
jgi:hypothetical protein